MKYLLKYLLDTNACIKYLNFPDSSIRRKIEITPNNEIAVCSIVKAELFYGSKKSKNPTLNLAKQMKFLNQFHSLPFDDNAALIFGEIRAELAAQGKPIGPYDLQIAAIALANDLILITHNTSEFSRISRLQIEDWETP
jgi:tRNA(fMet)-specific endonuclease VapC